MARVFPPHDVAKAIGKRYLDIEAQTLGELVAEGSRRYGGVWTDGIRKALVIVDGFNANARGGLSLRLAPDARVHFVTPAGGG